ncbi:hypothetical protein F2Q69_00058537 [Brassica cretica]|uniref:Uncharacterized protein n=1 Tax=Brassica cretica TaxID=69181 RepID=A0A8S9RM79_BRACR|nr:hypothetical protein F2Q69_00058537 [Brassica cretica]
MAGNREMELGRYVATELWFELGRYVATELWLELGRYVATDLWLEPGRYVVTELLAQARSLRSNRAEHVFGCCVATLFELLSDDSCFFRKVFHKEESILKKYLSKKYLSKKLAPQLVRVENLAGGLRISAKLGVLNEVYFKLRGREFSRKSKFQCGDGRGYISGADSNFSGRSADHLSFREKLVRRQAEKELVRAGAELPSSSALAVALGHGTDGVTPRDTGTLAGSIVPDASVLSAGSSTTPILVEDKERGADSMPPPPARKEIVLALHAPSVVPVTQPKGRKRKFTKGGDGESSQQGGSSIASGLRGKFVSLIDGMISECGSETSRLAGELLELQGRWSETEAMLTAVKDSHSVKVSKLEVAIGELERDLGKTASSLLKEKKARKAKSSEVRRLQRQIEGDAGLNLSCFLVSHVQVNTSSNRWPCESYQATTRDPSLGGLVSHIKHHLELGISKAFPQPSCDPSIHSVLHPEFISKSDPFE